MMGPSDGPQRVTKLTLLFFAVTLSKSVLEHAKTDVFEFPLWIGKHGAKIRRPATCQFASANEGRPPT
jgi:hypothetical protein